MNFKILTVNGRDISEASNEVATAAFQSASEPITVVIRRNNASSAPPASGEKKKRSRQHRSSTTTQDQEGSKHVCFCRFLMENCANFHNPTTEFIRRELTHYKNLVLNGESIDEEHVPSEDDDDDVFSVDYEEIFLKRPSKQDKLGIMLRDHRDPFTGLVKVIVSEVTPNSIGAQSQKIREGDHIVKINGSPITNTNEASHLLCASGSSITFLIGHPCMLESESGTGRQYDAFHDSLQSDGVLRDLTNYSNDDTRRNNLSKNLLSRYVGHRGGEGCSEFSEIVSQKRTRDNNGTTESGISNISAESGNYTEKDSGIDRTIDSTIQGTIDNAIRTNTDGSRHFGSGCSQANSVSHSLAREFTYVQPQNYHCKKRVSPLQHKSPASDDSADSAKGSMERPGTGERKTEYQRLNEAIGNLKLEESHEPAVSRLPSMEDFYKGGANIVSPWLMIARQDYEEKMRQLETSDDLRNVHPALSPDNEDDLNAVVTALSTSRSPSITTDNTSSAYSTGESFRSSSTTSAPRLSDEPITPPFKKQPTSNSTKKNNLQNSSSVTITYYMSSDANSDSEGPACYLTHNDDSESEGFEDAGLEFSSPALLSAPACSEQMKPVPLPRILHPRFGLGSNSLTASTKELCKAAAAVAQNRRHSVHHEVDKVRTTVPSYHVSERHSENRRSPTRRRSNSRGTTEGSSSKDRSESETVIAANCRNCGEVCACIRVSPDDQCNLNESSNFTKTEESNHKQPLAPKVRRETENSKKPERKSGRSVAFANVPFTQDNEETANAASDQSFNEQVRMEWKVRVSKDGTRYITKRPVREKVLRNREKRLLAERCGLTTDDDMTELKLGRHWSRDERKRHMRIAREKRLRRDFMQRCRLEVLNENTPADGEIVELSHKKMTRQKHKRMLLDNFVTVQELLAHGDRSSDVAKLNPLLSVTYI